MLPRSPQKMPYPAVRRPGDQDWEKHRPEMERMYSEENKSLREVMSYMEGKYSFFARKNQYEKYLIQKWRLCKNSTSLKWEAITPVVEAMERSGKQVEVLIHGKKKSLATIRKETKRHAYSEHSRSIRGLPQELPPGVIVREVPSSTMLFIPTKLPFHGLEDHLKRSLPIITGDSKPTTPFPLFRANSGKIWRPSREVEEALRAVVAQNQRSEDSFNFSLMRPDTQVFPSPLHRCILFSVANNFAGIGALPKEQVIEFLQRETSEGLYRMIHSAPEYYTTQALAINLFRAAIEVGDSRTVGFLLKQPLLGIEPNRFIFYHRGARYTPIERAAALLRTSVVKILLENGADPNLSDSRERPRMELKHIGGALNCAARAVEADRTWDRKRVSEIDLELFQMLVNAGATLDNSYLRNLIQYDQEGNRVLSIMNQQAAFSCEDWNMAGIFCHAFRYLNHEASLAMLNIMLQHGVDLNLGKDQGGYDTEKVIEVVAGRGDKVIIESLFEAGARMTDDTLPRAISSGETSLVRYLLGRNANTNTVGRMGISSLAASIRVQNQEIMDLIVEHQGLATLKDQKYFSSALEAAAEVGEVKWIENLVSLGGEVRPEDLGTALTIATKDGRQNIALMLIEAGADTNMSGNQSGPPLQEALKRQDPVLVRALLDADANPNFFSNPHDIFCYVPPAIEWAVRWGDPGIIQDVIRVGADLNAYCRNSPALNIAIERKDMKLLDMLLDAGCDINNPRARLISSTALEASVITGDLRIINYVLDHGADPHDPGALFQAFKQDSAVIDLLLQKHTTRYPRGRKGWGSEILKMAIENDDYETFKKILLNGGADANQCLGSTTPFGYAIATSKRTGLRFIDLLLQHSNKTNCTPETIVSRAESEGPFGGGKPIARVTALLAAIGAGHCPAVELLLRHGADVNYPAVLGVKRTPLQRAAEVGDLGIIELLLGHGADVNAPPAQRGGGTALQLASLNGFIPVVELFLKHGADVHAPASKVDGRSPLEGAAEHGRLDMITVLLEAGAGSKGKDKPQFTRAITLAEENGHEPVANLLKGYILDGKIRSCANMFEDLVDWDFDE